ncbi:hypothetical protein M8J75_015154 [Diaphorina citri]|nr:hypothetical protein M8J75_015154 [Diaphorina citri]
MRPAFTLMHGDTMDSCAAVIFMFLHDTPLAAVYNLGYIYSARIINEMSKLNCEVLHDSSAFEVRWAIAGDSIVLQLVAKLEFGEYMSFGLSGDPLRNQMIGADVVVAWIDQETLNGYAVDYYLTDKSQCAGGRGSCPDYRIQDNTESVRLLNAALVNGYSIVTYQRPLRSHDILDHDIYTNQSQAIIWAIGPLNSKQEVSFHSVFPKKNILFNFGRTPYWNCPIPEGETGTPNHGEYSDESSGANTKVQEVAVEPARSKSPPTPAPAPRDEAWEIPPIQCNEPDDGVLYAQMGPTGGKRGYPAITGHVGWGISWYINGLLIPEINVVRGKTYTFIVEGGLDPNTPAKYHPFYITDDSVGGYQHKTPEEKEKVRIFAGAKRDKFGNVVPTGVGRLCNWTPDPEQPPADEFVSFGAYQRTLSLICDHGEPGVIQWTPDANTPDTVYYQCFTHRYLGWKINVLNSCDKEAQSSEPVTTRIRADDYTDDQSADSELESRPSIKVTTRVKPDGTSDGVSAETNSFHNDLSQIIPHKFKDSLKSDFKKTPLTSAEIPDFVLTSTKFNGYNQHEMLRQQMEERERQMKEKKEQQENEIKRKREQEKDGHTKYEVKEDDNSSNGDQNIDKNRKDIRQNTNNVLIQQSLEPLTIHEHEIKQALDLGQQQYQQQQPSRQTNINQTIEQHFQQNLDLNTEKSVPVAFILNGNQQYSTNQPFLLTTYGGSQNFISTSSNPHKQPMVVYPANQKENKINAYSLQPTTPLSIQKHHQQTQQYPEQQHYSTIQHNQQYSTQKYITTPQTPIYLQNPISIARPVSGQIRNSPNQDYSQNSQYTQGPPQHVSQFSQGHRVQAEHRPQQQTPNSHQFSSAPANYNPYSTYPGGFSQSPSTGPAQFHGQSNFISHPSGKDNIPYKTGYILLQNNNPKRPVNVNVYKRPISNPNIRRPNVIIKKPIYKNKAGSQSAQPTKHIMLVKPVNSIGQSASSLSQVVITPKVHGNADTYPTTPSKKVTVTYSTSSAQANLNKIKPVLPLLVAEKPRDVSHTKIQKKSEIVAPSTPIKSGFNPSSVVIESGFKPIITVEDEAQKRMSDDDVEYIDETTIANVVEQVTNASNVLETKQTENFEPIFIPSPPDQQKLRKEKKPIVSKPVRQVLVRKRIGPLAQDERKQYKVRQEQSEEQVQTYFLPPSGPIYGVPKNLNKKQEKVTHIKKDLLHTAEEKEHKKEENNKLKADEDEKEVKIEKAQTPTVSDNNEIKKVNNLKEESNSSVQTTPKYKNHKYEEVEKINEKLKDEQSEEDVATQEQKVADYTVIDSVEEGRNEKKLKFTRKYPLLRPRRSPHHHPDHKGNDTEHDNKPHTEDSHQRSHRDRRTPRPHHTPDHHGDASDYNDENHDHMHEHDYRHFHNITSTKSSAVTTYLSLTLLAVQFIVIALR